MLHETKPATKLTLMLKTSARVSELPAPSLAGEGERSQLDSTQPIALISRHAFGAMGMEAVEAVLHPYHARAYD